MEMIIVELEHGYTFRVSKELAEKNGWVEFKRNTVESKPANNKALKPKASKEDTEKENIKDIGE